MTPILKLDPVRIVLLDGTIPSDVDESGDNLRRKSFLSERLHEMVHAIIWEILQCLLSEITAEIGKIMGGEMHKSRMVEKAGEDGR